MHQILREERDIVISSRPLEATAFQIDNIRIAYIFYESGLSINVMYTEDDPKERAVGFKLSEGMEVPAELTSRSSSRGRSRSQPELFAVSTSHSRTSTDTASEHFPDRKADTGEASQMPHFARPGVPPCGTSGAPWTIARQLVRMIRPRANPIASGGEPGHGDRPVLRTRR